MIKLISSNTNGYIFNLKDFLSLQKEIRLKFSGPLEGLNTMEIIDKYLLQIIEEIWEVKHAKNDEEYIEEVIDVLMYLGSLFTILEDDLERTKITTIKECYTDFNIDDVTKDLISFRRLFPARKWHKNEMSIKQDEIKIASVIVLDLIFDILKYLNALEDFKNFNIEIEKKIKNKQDYILGL